MTATTLSPREMKRLRKQGADYVSPSPYTVKAAFQRGDLFTKLSAVVFGLGNIVRKQYVKGITMLVLEKGAEDPTFGYLQSLVNSFGSGIGFLVAMVLFAGVRERLENCDIPETFKGLPITLVAASLVAVSFLGFNGVVDNLL